MKVQATLGNLFLRKMEAGESKTESGIILSTESAETSRSIRGEVLSTGGKKLVGNQLLDMEAKVGDTVLFDVYKASEYQYDGVTYYSISEDMRDGKGGICGILK